MCVLTPPSEAMQRSQPLPLLDESGAPVTGAAFAKNDMQVTDLYHQLATRHDALVDWVIKQTTTPTQ